MSRSVPLSPTESRKSEHDIPPAEAITDVAAQIEATTIAPVKLSRARLITIAAIVTLTMCLGGANAMGVTIALPNIQSELNMRPTDLQWIASVYTLTNGCFLLLAGRLADIYGRKLLFVTGLAWLAIWTLIGGFMPTGVALIITRALAGIGNAMSTPSAIGLIASYYTGKSRTYAFAAFAAGAPAGSAVGLVLGGVFTSYTARTWRAILWTFGAVAFVITLLAQIFIPTQVTKTNDKRVDWLGAALVTVGLVLIMFVISAGATASNGWATPYIIALLILGVLMIVAFVFWERHVTSREIVPPLVRLHLFVQSKGRLSAVYFIGFITWMGFSSLLYHSSLFYQQVQDTGPIGAMLRFLPTAIMGVLCNVIIALIVSRVRTQWIICFGTLCTTVANILFALAPKDSIYWGYAFNGMWLSVFGVDFLMSTGSIFVAALALPEEQSVAGAVSQTLVRLGGSFGLAVTSSIAETYTNRSLQAGVSDTDALLNGLHASFWLGAGFSVSSLVVATIALRGLGIIAKKNPK